MESIQEKAIDLIDMLRERRCLSETQLAALADRSEATVRDLLRCNRKRRMNILQHYVQAMDASLQLSLTFLGVGNPRFFLDTQTAMRALTEYRMRHNISAASMAEKLGCSEGYVYDFGNRPRDFFLSTVQDFADALDVGIDIHVFYED